MLLAAENRYARASHAGSTSSLKPPQKRCQTRAISQKIHQKSRSPARNHPSEACTVVPKVQRDPALSLTAYVDALPRRHLRPELVLDGLHAIHSLALGTRATRSFALQCGRTAPKSPRWVVEGVARRGRRGARAPVVPGQEEQRLFVGAPLGRQDLRINAVP